MKLAFHTAIFEIRFPFIYSESNFLTLSEEVLVHIQFSCGSWLVHEYGLYSFMVLSSPGIKIARIGTTFHIIGTVIVTFTSDDLRLIQIHTSASSDRIREIDLS